MANEITLNIFEIVGSRFCVSPDDGQKVHDQIELALKQGLQVRLSFANVERLISAFLNVAIGQLYGEFPEDVLRNNLSVIHIEKSDLILLKRVIDTAKIYFKNPEMVERIRRQSLGEENDGAD
jgi:hypothetical protein